MIVAACNTASAFALDEIEKETDIPIIGVIKPGARVAAAVTENGRIGVIGTEGTIDSSIYSRYIKNQTGGSRYGQGVSPVCASCGGGIVGRPCDR